MIEDITILSATEMRCVKPRLSAIVISILDESERGDRPRLAGFGGALTLTFQDCEESRGETRWPDEPTDAEHALFASGQGERVPTLAEARRIVEFVWAHQQRPERLSLLVHCFAGVSRSAAVAEWASARWQVPIRNIDKRPTDGANQRLLRLLDKANQEFLATLGP